MKDNNMTEQKVNLRDLDDIACSNVIVTRQIKRMINKIPNLKECPIDCWIHSTHYTNFKLAGDKFKWFSDNKNFISGWEVIKSDNDEITKDDLHKILIYTFRAMCDANNSDDIVDTPEDLLAFAETKLREMLREENTEDTATE
jgi:hypothetical protein